MLCVLMLSLLADTVSSQEGNIKVLSFGGNGNIGSAVLANLINNGKAEIFQVSRGNWKFDSATRIAPHVQSFICDRARGRDVNAIHRCSDLMQLIQSTDKFDVVLDFSAYEAKWIGDNVEVLKDKVGVYIYISTDSVYEVSVPKKEQWPSKETDAVRPEDQKELKKLAKADNYGHGKLAGEEVLIKQQKYGGFPWVSLRLADVIGPRDTTDRWWRYQMWIQFYHAIGKPIYMPAKVADKIESLTYVEDVPRVIDAVIEKGPAVWNQAYNIAMEEEFSLANILFRMGDVLKVEGVIGDSKESRRSFHFYPSVFGGPIDISKAKEMLDFSPTMAGKAFEETIKWYDEAFVKFPEKRNEILQDFFEMIVPKENRDNVYKEIDRFLASKEVNEKKFKKRRKYVDHLEL